MKFTISRQRRQELRELVERPEPAVQLVAEEQLDWDRLSREVVEAMPALLDDLYAAEREIGFLKGQLAGAN